MGKSTIKGHVPAMFNYRRVPQGKARGYFWDIFYPVSPGILGRTNWWLHIQNVRRFRDCRKLGCDAVRSTTECKYRKKLDEFGSPRAMGPTWPTLGFRFEFRVLVLVVIAGSRRVEGFILHHSRVNYHGLFSTWDHVFTCGELSAVSCLWKTSDSAEMNVVPFLAA